MNVRAKRLENEYQQLKELERNSGGKLKVISAQGSPPYKFVIEYHCRGIKEIQGNSAVFGNKHQVEISVGSNYPKQSPTVRFLTPIFHPNVYPSKDVCLGRYWTMSETIPLLVLRIGKIIQYSKDVMNLNSPANGSASTWAANNMSTFPIDNQTFKMSNFRINNQPFKNQMVWNDR